MFVTGVWSEVIKWGSSQFEMIRLNVSLLTPPGANQIASPVCAEQTEESRQHQIS